MDTTFAMFAVLGFLAVVLALEGLYNLWASKSSPEARRVADRLSRLHGEHKTELSLEKARELSVMPRVQAWIETHTLGRPLNAWVVAAGSPRSTTEMIILSSMLALLGFIVPVLIAKPLPFSLLLALILGYAPWWQLARTRAKRIEVMERQLPEALDMMGRAMRAGHAFPTAMRLVGDDLAEPMGKDFRILADEINYGVNLQDALERLATRIPLEDVRYFMVAVLIQREAGGNLAELLDNIASIVRGRLKLQGEVRTLSAEGKLSGKILAALPFLMGGAMYLLNPTFLSILWTDPTGLKLLGGALCMMVVGIIWMSRITQIRV